MGRNDRADEAAADLVAVSCSTGAVELARNAIEFGRPQLERRLSFVELLPHVVVPPHSGRQVVLAGRLARHPNLRAQGEIESMPGRAPRPTRADEIVAWLRANGGSATLGEIADGLGNPFHKHRTIERRMQEEAARPEPRLRQEDERWITVSAIRLSPEELADLEAGLAEADRGETVTAEELLERLRRFG